MTTTEHFLSEKRLTWLQLPSGIVIKTIPGLGATYLELRLSKRNSIVLSPLTSIVKSKEDPSILSIYGDVKEKQEYVDQYLSTRPEFIKIHSTVESFPYLFQILKSK